jgi:hypothetical protein
MNSVYLKVFLFQMLQMQEGNKLGWRDVQKRAMASRMFLL